VEYHFVSPAEFEQLRRDGHLLEWANIYGNLYGTSRKGVDEILQRGEDVLLDIDVQGAQTLRQKCPEALSIFILPPSFQVLRERLEKRKLDKKYIIEQRLSIACDEIQQYRYYDYLIVNDEFEKSADELKAIILGARCRLDVRAERVTSILRTFGGVDAQHP